MTKEIHKEKHLSHPKYRADIDGLRAVAILLVVFFHAFNLRGGFIGVDIFFVISGFLISTIIFNNLDSGNFSFREFYARRVKRIFPALILVLSFCLIFGWFVLFDQEYRQLGYHVFRGSIFIINFQLLRESGYFDNAAELKPLLHLWSLSVEEQFYIIWPLILFIVYKVKSKPKSKPKSKLFVTSVIIFISSFAFSVFSVRHNSSGAFYLPYSRFWEMMMGAILAYYNIYKANSFNNFKNKIGAERLQNFLSSLGAILIVIGVLTIRRDSFPGEWALLPTFGAAFIIAGKDGWFNKNILQNKILIWFGLISYPLYLWHWPLLSFAKIIEDGNLSFLLRSIIVVFSIILAWLTYYFVEKPIRFGKQDNKLKILILSVVIISIGFVGYLLKKKDGVPERKISINANAFLNNLKIDIKKRKDLFCDDKNLKEYSICAFEGNLFPDSLIIGDSHAQALYVALKDKYKQKGKNLAVITTGGFPILFNLSVKDGLKDERNTLEISKVVKTIIDDSRVKEVILISRGTLYTTSTGFGNFDMKSNVNLVFDGVEQKLSNYEAFKKALYNTISELAEKNKKIIYVNSVPDLGFIIESCMDVRPFRIFSKPRNPCAIVKSEYDKYSIDHKNLVNNVLSHFPTVKVINLSEAVCDNELCYGMMNTSCCMGMITI
jgi:peptidoglycan/LPS O-acetylase OafA/YrhL